MIAASPLRLMSWWGRNPDTSEYYANLAPLAACPLHA